MDQNQNTMNQGGAAPSGAPQEAPMGGGMPESAGGGKKPMGPVIGIIVIVILLILGGLYLWGGSLTERAMTPEEILNEEDAMLMKLGEQNTSDEVADIEADLNATDLEGLDAELEQIDAEF